MNTLQNTNEKNERWGLALGGGGSRGSFTIVVIKALVENGYYFNAVTGVSIGALAGAGYVMQTDKGLDEWIERFKSDMVVDHPFAFPNANRITKLTGDLGIDFINQFSADGPSIAPLIKTYSDYFNFDDFKKSDIDFACLTYNVSQNKPVIFYKKDMTKDDCVIKLMTSTAYFPAFNFVEYNNDQYADGSYCNIPLGQEIMKMNVEHVIAVSLHNGDEKPLAIAPGIHMVIHPILNLKYFLDFNVADLKKQIAQGYLETLKFLDQAPGYIYTFYQEDEAAFRTLSDLTDKVLDRVGLTLDNERLIDGLSQLLGYRPAPLENELMKNYTAGLIFECLGLVAGMDPYQQYHLMDFSAEVLRRLSQPESDPEEMNKAMNSVEMEVIGARDLLVFFHAGLKSFDGKLPAQFDCFREKYGSIYYLAFAWLILEKFSALFSLSEKVHDLEEKFSI